MHGFDATAILHASMITTFKLCLPLLLAPLISGLGTAVFQALTQISDTTLSFLPKLCATMAVAYYAGPFISSTLSTYMKHSFDQLVLIGGR
jgi:flagellar biosynthetic protein FliQ